MQDNQHAGVVALTWQQVILGLMIFPLGATIIFVCSARAQDLVVAWGSLCATVAVIGLLIWSQMRAGRRPDREPDVLAAISDGGQIRETGPLHVAWRIAEKGRWAQWAVIVQNVLDGPAAAGIALWSVDYVERQYARAVIELDGAEVVVAIFYLPSAAWGAGRLTLRTTVDVWKSSGRRVRFARRGLIIRPKTGFAAVAAVAGLIGGSNAALRAGRTMATDEVPAVHSLDLAATQTVREKEFPFVRLASLWRCKAPFDPQELNAKLEKLLTTPDV